MNEQELEAIRARAPRLEKCIKHGLFGCRPCGVSKAMRASFPKGR